MVLPINRAASIHDVMFNTLGGFLGGLAAILVARLAQKSGRSADTSSLELQPETT